jgi:hypothetical protein
MTSHGRASLESTKQFDAEERRADHEQEVERGQREDTALKREVPHHPFDWKDFLLFVIPSAIAVLGIWRDA